MFSYYAEPSDIHVYSQQTFDLFLFLLSNFIWICAPFMKIFSAEHEQTVEICSIVVWSCGCGPYVMQPNVDVFVHKVLFYAYNVVASGSWPPDLLGSTCCKHVAACVSGGKTSILWLRWYLEDAATCDIISLKRACERDSNGVRCFVCCHYYFLFFS